MSIAVAPTPASAQAASVPADPGTLVAQLERAAYLRQLAEGADLFVRLMDALGRVTGGRGLISPRPTEAGRREFYTRAAAAITTLVNTPEFVLSESQFADLCARKPMLEAVFELSGFGGADHLVRLHAKVAADGLMTITSGQAFYLALFYSLDRLLPELAQTILLLPPNHQLMLTMGWLSAPFVHTATGEANRNMLLGAYERLKDVSFVSSNIAMVGLSTTWMHCSYADSPDKHRFKGTLNEIWRRFCAREGMRAKFRPYCKIQQPVLLVLAERMRTGHAMHRSYAACIEQLRQRFRVVCMVHEMNHTPDTAQLFDEMILLQGSNLLSSIAARVVRLQPDLIYYPSLGMSEWTVALASLRFAPIQFMTLGHPAPAMLDTIDYSLVQAGHGEAAHEFGVKVLERQAWGNFVPYGDIDFDKIERSRADDGALHVAINSSMMKLSPRFLAVCQRIQAEARRPVHFDFFASAGGVSYDQIDALLEPLFPRMTLHELRPYADFLQQLSRCELALAAFPFGNTNSTVDTCLLGIPTVAYVANEVLSIGDRDVLRVAGMPDWLVSRTDEDYFQTAMKLIHDDALRESLSQQLKTTDLRSRLFSPARSEDATEFVDAVWWMYENHEALQRSPAHLLKIGEPIPA